MRHEIFCIAHFFDHLYFHCNVLDYTGIDDFRRFFDEIKCPVAQVIYGEHGAAYQLRQLARAELAQYRVPGTKGLYLSGAFMYPGGGLTGGGHAVAMWVMEDLGIMYSSIIKS